MMERRASFALVITIQSLFAAIVAAADHEEILPFVTDDVAAVAYIELASVRTSAILDELDKFEDMPTEQWSEVARVMLPVQRWVDELVDQGAMRVYLLLRATDVPDTGTTWVVTLRHDAKPDAVTQLLKSGPREISGEDKPPVGMPKYVRVTNGTVLAAMTSARLEHTGSNRREVPRPTLVDALDTLGGGQLGLIVIGDPDSRRVIREMLPRLSKPFDAIDGRLLADDVLWTGVAINMPPAFKLTLHAETSRPEVARDLQQSALAGLERITSRMNQSSDESLRATAQQLQSSLDLLKPACDGTALRICLGDDEGQLARLRGLVSRPLAAAAAAAQQRQRVNQFKLLALAALNYESAHGTFVPQASYDRAGRPLLSWRVRLLPYLDRQELYEQFHLDEPWDSPHNRQLISEMPSVFADPDPRTRRAVGMDRTTFVAPVANETVFPPAEALPEGKPLRIRDLTDGTSKTIMLVEVVPERSAIWTQPEDWRVDLDHPLQGVARTDRPGFTCARCDSSVQVLPNDIPPQSLRALLTRAAGDRPE
jgi:hypothetical protein